MPDAVVRIRSAPGTGAELTVPRTFVVTGLILGADAGGLELTMTNQQGRDVPFHRSKVITVRGPDTTGRRALRWMARVRMANSNGDLRHDRYNLHFTPLLRANRQPHVGGHQSLLLNWEGLASDFVGIDHPTQGYTIDGDELDFFYATGESDVPVWNAWISKGDVARAANYVWWVSESNYWVAEFLYLRENPGTDRDYTFSLDVQGSPTRTVHIA